MPDRPVVRSERTNETHLLKGAAVPSKGRWIAQTECGHIIAGATVGPDVPLTCPACQAAGREETPDA